jgi:hypothetical protein
VTTLMPWAAVEVGDILSIPQKGKPRVWTVTEIQGSSVTVERDDGFKHTGQPVGEVEVISSGAEARQMAIATSQVWLGGEVIAIEDNGIHLVPSTFPDPASLLAHAYLLHGVSLVETEMALIIRKHEWLHRPENKVAGTYVEHNHDPEFYRHRAWEPPPAFTA